ncbi:MAG: CoB--CoM heterodisulfide reductase iron-sulfur subunit B family protein [Nitrososphaeria archaeon]
MRYALFLGCTIPARSRDYELSSRKVAERLGVELVDLNEFACCGFPIESLDQEAALLMAARNLGIAESKGLDMCTLCSACTSILTETNQRIQEDGAVRTRVNKKLAAIDKNYTGSTAVTHFSRVLFEDIGIERIEKETTHKLTSLKIAPHYGCHYLKPSNIYDRFDDPENPKTLHRLIAATDAQVVSYEREKDCCGGGVLAVDEDLALGIAREKLQHAKAAGADAICLICPFCAIMYDDNQRKIEAKFSETYGLPVIYYAQLLGLALGMSAQDLGLSRAKTEALLTKI